MKLTIPKKPAPADHRPLGAEMRRRREAKGFALREVARRLGISAPFLSDLELGRRNWTEELRDSFLKAIKKPL